MIGCKELASSRTRGGVDWTLRRISSLRGWPSVGIGLAAVMVLAGIELIFFVAAVFWIFDESCSDNSDVFRCCRAVLTQN